MLRWSQDQLADAAKVGKATVANFEREETAPQDRTLRDLRVALEAAGIVFLAEGEDMPGGLGLRLCPDTTNRT